MAISASDFYVYSGAHIVRKTVRFHQINGIIGHIQEKMARIDYFWMELC